MRDNKIRVIKYFVFCQKKNKLTQFNWNIPKKYDF